MEEQYNPEDYSRQRDYDHYRDHYDKQYGGQHYEEESQFHDNNYDSPSRSYYGSRGGGQPQAQYQQYDDHGQYYNNNDYNYNGSGSSYRPAHSHNQYKYPEDNVAVPVPKFLKHNRTSDSRAGLSNRGLSSRVTGYNRRNHNAYQDGGGQIMQDRSMKDDSQDVHEGPTTTFPTTSSASNSSASISANSTRGLRGKRPPSGGRSRDRTQPYHNQIQRHTQYTSTRSFGSGSSGSLGIEDAPQEVFENEGESVYSGRTHTNSIGDQSRDRHNQNYNYQHEHYYNSSNYEYYPDYQSNDASTYNNRYIDSAYAGTCYNHDEQYTASAPQHPHATYNGDFGRYDGRENNASMGDQSNYSTASHDTGASSRRDFNKTRGTKTRGTNSQVRGTDSLRMLDESIQESIDRQDFEHYRRPNAMSESSCGSRERFHNRNMDASSDAVDGEAGSSRVENDRYAEKLRNQHERMKASLRTVDGLTIAAQGFISQRTGLSSTTNRQSRPGVFRGDSQSTPQDAALRAKLDSHFGVEPVPEQKEGDFSHVKMLQPRRYDSPYLQSQQRLMESSRTGFGSATGTRTTATSTASGCDTDQEDASVEVHEDEPDENAEPRQSQDQVNVPRDITVDEDVQQARTSIHRKKEGPSLVLLTKVGAFILLCFIGASVGTTLCLAVLNAEPTSDEKNGNEDDPTSFSFEEGLPTTTLAILADKDPDSPQYMAMQWLQDEELFLSYPVWRKQQRFALCTIYFALFHDEEQDAMPWFKPNVDECEWQWNPDESVYCDNDGRFTHLSLRLDHQKASGNNDLFDTADGNSTYSDGEVLPKKPMAMPLEVGMLKLDELKLSHIPGHAELAYLLRPEMLASEHLVKLEITRSPDLGGTIPTGVGFLSNLNYFYLEDTNVVGTIPSEIGKLTQLKELNIAECPSLIGSIPSEVGGLSEVQLFWIFSNENLSGPLPSEMGLMTNVNFVLMKSNRLTGVMPSELGSMTWISQFKVNDNDLTGTIPSELGSWSLLRVFDVSDNDGLGGTVPLGICRLRADIVDYEIDCEKISCCDHWTGKR